MLNTGISIRCILTYPNLSDPIIQTPEVTVLLEYFVITVCILLE